LAAALNAVPAALEAVKEAERARFALYRRRSEAEAALELARGAAGEAGAVDEGAAEGLISDLADGRPPDFTAVRRPRAVAEQAVREAEVRLRSMEDAATLCRKAIADREEAVVQARAQVVTAAAQVVRVGAPWAELMDGLADMEREVIARRAGLAFLAAFVPDAQAARLKGLLGQSDVLLPTLTLRTAGFDRLPVIVGWKAAVEALRADPQASLPSIEITRAPPAP
jgi:hypothetical protein